MECLSLLRSIKNQETQHVHKEVIKPIATEHPVPFRNGYQKNTYRHIVGIEQTKIIRKWFSHHRGPFHVKLDHRGKVLWHLRRILWWSFARRKGQGNWTYQSGPWPLCQFYQGALREKVGKMRIWIFVFNVLNKRSPILSFPYGNL